MGPTYHPKCKPRLEFYIQATGEHLLSIIDAENIPVIGDYVANEGMCYKVESRTHVPKHNTIRINLS